MANPQKKEKYNYYNHLVSVVKGLEDHYVTIDLRNESCIIGKISYVDGCMNVELTDAVLYDSRGSEHHFETFCINSRQIRYVHIPKDMPASEIVKDFLKTLIIPKPPKVATSYKIRRAQRYQQQIINSLFQTEEENMSTAGGT